MYSKEGKKKEQIRNIGVTGKNRDLVCSGIPANQGSSRSQRQCCEMCHHLSAEPWNSLLKNLLFLSL